MTDRPIIFSAPMILALLAGRKTQTRRVLKPQPFPAGYHQGDVTLDRVWEASARFSATAVGGGAVVEDTVPLRFAPGDRLWVREAWRPDPNGPEHDGSIGIFYRASRLQGVARPAEGWKLPKQAQAGAVTPLHMPRWASRLTLTVTDVRVQPLQEISEDDARAEGVVPVRDPTGAVWFHGPSTQICGQSVQDGFRRLWNSLHGPDAWAANPWVAAVTFTVEHRNIDAGGA